MICKLKTVRADMLALRCQLERELIRYVRRYLNQPQVTIITNDKRDREVEHMDTIRDSIETRANDVLKRDKNRESR